MIGWLPLAFVTALAFQAQPTGTPGDSGSFRLLRSLSGPSGTVVGSKFMFDETRNRFVFPANSSLIVYFEWEGPPGKHTLTGLWKDPTGKTASISPDIQMQADSPQFNAYWTFHVVAGMPSGVWTVEVRIDGQPAGSHSFELVVPESEATTRPRPTLSEIYKTVGASLVWVHKIDEQGRRIDTSSGFVIAQSRVATAFQSIDAAIRLEIEFPDGRKALTDAIWACHRLQDWAVVKVDTAGAPPLRTGSPEQVVIGEEFVTFNADSGQSRVIGRVDISGRRSVPGFGERIQFAPALTPEAAGSPLLTLEGHVVGIVGGSLIPGSRSTIRESVYGLTAFPGLNSWNAAAPTSLLPAEYPSPPQTLKALVALDTLTPPFYPTPVLQFGGTAKTIPKANEGLPVQPSQFSRRDAQVFVYSFWQRKEKISRGVVSALVYNAGNSAVIKIEPKKINLPSERSSTYVFSFSPAPMTPGIYRVDILWDGRPAWRTFFQIVD